MKINLNQLTQHLAGHLLPFYLISGDEPLLVQKASDQIREKAKASGYDERERFQVEAGFDWNELFQSANEMSLFSSRKTIEVRIPGKLTDHARKTLLELAERPNEDNLFIVVTGKLESSTTKSKWFLQLEKQIGFIQIWPLENKDFAPWIRQQFAMHNHTIEPEALDILADRVDGNLLAAHQEIEKLLLLTENPLINTELVIQAVGDSSRYDVFDLTNACLFGELPRAVKILNGLKAEGTEAPIILWALSRELRTLSMVLTRLSAGQPKRQVFQQNGVWKNREAAYEAAMSRCSISLINKLLTQAGRVDSTIKGLEKSDTWMELHALILGMCRTDANTRLIPALIS
ncbi:DNA polymerase III subunit delta [Gynuella sunshinyii]|uniref:DNA polymerase III subunit delta n=1 Tax=Gynuella sunshinyii YC6258 TaxID=1445510 RepID=A0A0C5V787_9GAMM|nr:DNA polymerase III subunit delta [Gynuella sunshinyii]AJQ95255.1 DNA polymerase III, delta subunit [Gynuella sunshinyii YC6258]